MTSKCLRCKREIVGCGPIEKNYNQVLGLCEECQEIVDHALADYNKAMETAFGNYDAEDAMATLVRVLYPSDSDLDRWGNPPGLDIIDGEVPR